MRRKALFSILLAGCAAPDASLAPGFDLPGPTEDPVSEEPDAADSDAAAVCAASVAWVTPDDGARDVPVDAVVRVGFTAPVAPEAWSLALVGVPGAASLAEDGLTASFAPQVPLAWSQNYAVEASACGSRVDHTFATLGRPVAVEDLEDRVWTVSLDAATWLSPAVASVFASQLSLGHLVLGTHVRADGALGLRAWSADDDLTGFAPTCGDAIELGELDLSRNPHLATLPRDLRITTGGGGVTVLGSARIEATLTNEGATLSDLSVHARIDARLIAAGIGLLDLCALAESFGDRCVPCADGEEHCLQAVLNDLVSLDLAEEAISVPSCGPR